MKKILTVVFIADVIIGIIFYIARPRPLEVETAVCAKGSIRTFIWEEAETRLDDEYIVSMPVSGRLLRIDFKEGHEVKKMSRQISGPHIDGTITVILHDPKRP